MAPLSDPPFAALIEGSKERTALASADSIVSEARAIAALNGGRSTITDADMTEAAGDTTGVTYSATDGTVASGVIGSLTIPVAGDNINVTVTGAGVTALIATTPLAYGTHVFGTPDAGLGVSIVTFEGAVNLKLDGAYATAFRYQTWTGTAWTATETTPAGSTVYINGAGPGTSVFAFSPVMLYAVQTSPDGGTTWSETRYVSAQQANEPAFGLDTVTVLTDEQIAAADPGDNIPDATF